MKSKNVLATIIALLSLFPLQTSAQKQSSVRVRMNQLLGLSPQKTAPKAEILKTSEEDDVIIEDLRFQADSDNWVPAMIVKPRGATQKLPAIICLPGTSGTRQHLTDARLRLTEFPRLGWARALAKQGFLTISLDYRGSEARNQDIYLEALREQLAGRSFMGILVQETIRTVDYLQTRKDVDGAKLGITGFSLGGAITWYTAAVEPRLSVIVPVCGGAGMYDDLLRSRPNANYHSQYFYPAGFLKLFPGDQPDVFAALAPRAVLIVGRDQDQGMPIDGLRELEQKNKAVYDNRKVPDRFAVHVTAGNHTYTNEMFAQVGAWFVRFLKNA